MAWKLVALAEAGAPVRVGVIGAGKFASMFLSQAPLTRGLHVVGIADLPARPSNGSGGPLTAPT
jgi:predicted homoserine dehydrogenase-like protein